MSAAVLAGVGMEEAEEGKKKTENSLNHCKDNDEEMNGWVSLHAENV